MKPFLGIDITTNRNNEELNGQEFVTQKVSATRADMRDRAVDNVQQHENQAKVPKPLRILSVVFMFLGLAFLSVILRVLGSGADISVADAYKSAPWLFWLCGICLVIWFGLLNLGRKRAQLVSQSGEVDQAVSQADQLVQSSYDELSVPHDAENVDILLFRYVEKDGEVVPKHFGPITFIACDSKIFVENESLCLADVDQRYEFPLADLRRIQMVSKSAAIPSWNKSVAPNQHPYAEYKLRIDSYGLVYFKYYYILELVRGDETWGIWFPNYELPLMERLTGLNYSE